MGDIVGHKEKDTGLEASGDNFLYNSAAPPLVEHFLLHIPEN